MRLAIKAFKMKRTQRFESYSEAAAHSFMMGGKIDVEKLGSSFWANWVVNF